MKLSLSSSLFSGCFSKEMPQMPRKWLRLLGLDTAGRRSGCCSGRARPPFESPRRTSSPPQTRFPRWSPELHKNASGRSDFLAVDLHAPSSDRLQFEICWYPLRVLPSDRLDLPLESPITDGQGFRNGYWFL